MTDTLQAAQLISEALLKVAEAIDRMGCRIAEDEPLDFTLAHALHRLTEGQDEE